MERLAESVGVERELDAACHALKECVQRLQAPVVGALQVTCSDESEGECIDAFQRLFVSALLPNIKIWNKSAFRTSNLGGRYEWGSLPIAEHHFAAAASNAAFKCIVVKINAHVSVRQTARGPVYGPMERYGGPSSACGALHAMLASERLPFIDQLRETFRSEGVDRIAMLDDPNRVDPAYRHLFASMVSARLQARRVVLEIQDRPPTTPTVYLVAPCVTLNRPGYDTEIMCGLYSADARSGGAVVEYCGLGDDPSGYRMRLESDRLRIKDDERGRRRSARDHRRLVLRAWRGQKAPPPPTDERVTQVQREVEQKKHHDHPYAKAMLAVLVSAAIEVSPIPAAVVLFAEGAIGIYEANRMHRIARRERHAEQEARRLLHDFKEEMKALSPERMRAVIERLLAIPRA